MKEFKYVVPFISVKDKEIRDKSFYGWVLSETERLKAKGCKCKAFILEETKGEIIIVARTKTEGEKFILKSGYKAEPRDPEVFYSKWINRKKKGITFKKWKKDYIDGEL